ncbi:MAG: anti-sigma factor [Anaerolineae bacterium]|nr:anti-sigma factor [Phycisphaerae bacterium]
MSSEQANSTFDDPSFRSALRKQLVGETAPASLRSRIVAALDEVDTNEAPPRATIDRPSRSLFRRPLVGLAMAASILIVIGIGTFIALRSNAPAPRPVAVLPKPFAEAMAHQHDVCSDSNDHQTPGPPKTDLRLISKKLQEELGFQPLVTMLDDGWQFAGERICPIGDVRTAHLLFKRGEQSLSIFSIPGKAVYSPQDGAQYQVTVDQHPIAGFVRGTTMYCVVGKSAKGDLTLADMKKISDDLEKRMRDGKTARHNSSFDSTALASR